ncbi:MAG: SDR family oxidoreductase [bacterium]
MHVLLTGASSGIGFSILCALLARGDSVFAHHRSSNPDFERLAADESFAGRVETFRADFEDPDQVDALMEAYDKRWERLDALVNNAGTVIRGAKFEEIDRDLWRRTFAVNVEAPLFLSQWAFRKMTGGGKILNIGSISAKYLGGETTFHYGVSKAALDAVTQGLARRGAPLGILVNAIRPGITDTPAHRKYTPEKDLSERVKLNPLGRMARPEEIASLALYLLSGEADYITGEVISVAGGD